MKAGGRWSAVKRGVKAAANALSFAHGLKPQQAQSSLPTNATPAATRPGSLLARLMESVPATSTTLHVQHSTADAPPETPRSAILPFRRTVARRSSAPDGAWTPTAPMSASPQPRPSDSATTRHSVYQGGDVKSHSQPYCYSAVPRFPSQCHLAPTTLPPAAGLTPTPQPAQRPVVARCVTPHGGDAPHDLPPRAASMAALPAVQPGHHYPTRAAAHEGTDLFHAVARVGRAGPQPQPPAQHAAGERLGSAPAGVPQPAVAAPRRHVAWTQHLALARQTRVHAVGAEEGGGREEEQLALPSRTASMVALGTYGTRARRGSSSMADDAEARRRSISFTAAGAAVSAGGGPVQAVARRDAWAAARGAAGDGAA